MQKEANDKGEGEFDGGVDGESVYEDHNSDDNVGIIYNGVKTLMFCKVPL